MKLKFNDLFLAGSVVSVNVGYWRAKLSIRAEDLGVEETPEVRSALNLGFHRLLPTEEFEKIRACERAARNAIRYHGIDFPMVEGAYFVPDQAMPDLLEKLEKAKTDFFQARDEILAGYDGKRSTMIPTIRKALTDAARTTDPEILNAAHSRVVSAYPTARAVSDKFYFGWHVYSIGGARSEAVSNAAEREAADVQRVVTEMIQRLRNEIIEKIDEVTQLATSSGKLRQSSVDAVHAVLDRIDKVNFYGDQTLTTATNALRRIVTADNMLLSNELIAVRRTLTADVAAAVIEAEKNLTALGKRKIQK